METLPNRTVMENQNILNQKLTIIENKVLELNDRIDDIIVFDEVAITIPLGGSAFEITYGQLILVVAATLGGTTLLTAISSIPGVGTLVGTTNDEVVAAIETSLKKQGSGKPVVRPR